MKSSIPKVLHRVCGLPLVEHVLQALEGLGASRSYLIVGHGADAVRAAVGERAGFIVQEPQRGTGDAVRRAESEIGDHEGDVLVLSADVPLVTADVMQALVDKHRVGGAVLTLLTSDIPGSPTLGRVVKDAAGRVARIVEAREANAVERDISEVNAGTYCFDAAFMRDYLPRIGLPNAQNEVYITDFIILAARDGLNVQTLCWPDAAVTLGINTRVELALVEAILRHRIVERHMLDGVTVLDPPTTYIDAAVEIGRDTTLLPGVMLQGRTSIGEACEVGPYTRIVDSQIGSRCVIQNSIVLQSSMGEECTVGPFAYLRPGSELSRHVKVGDFVELKNARIGDDSKVPHLSYVGDATLGRHVNIGAGTITCNYDGKTKHHTDIEDGVHIGANTNLVAPVRVGRDSKTGAGSVVTRDVPPDSLAAGVPARVLKSLSGA